MGMSWTKGTQINTDKPAVLLQGISALTQMKTNQRKHLEECLSSALSQLDTRRPRAHRMPTNQFRRPCCPLDIPVKHRNQILQQGNQFREATTARQMMEYQMGSSMTPDISGFVSDSFLSCCYYCCCCLLVLFMTIRLILVERSISCV